MNSQIENFFQREISFFSSLSAHQKAQIRDLNYVLEDMFLFGELGFLLVGMKSVVLIDFPEINFEQSTSTKMEYPSKTIPTTTTTNQSHKSFSSKYIELVWFPLRQFYPDMVIRQIRREGGKIWCSQSGTVLNGQWIAYLSEKSIVSSTSDGFAINILPKLCDTSIQYEMNIDEVDLGKALGYPGTLVDPNSTEAFTRGGSFEVAYFDLSRSWRSEMTSSSEGNRSGLIVSTFACQGDELEKTKKHFMECHEKCKDLMDLRLMVSVSLITMKFIFNFVALFAVVSYVFAAVPLGYRCGGQGYTGDTVCVAPNVCQVVDITFSICVPAGVNAGPQSTNAVPIATTNAGIPPLVTVVQVSVSPPLRTTVPAIPAATGAKTTNAAQQTATTSGTPVAGTPVAGSSAGFVNSPSMLLQAAAILFAALFAF
ncbi:hypothetical protein HK098_007664 [Nowakowskiella sp. JEL0407]|nr:hypothetical protein HK098_007664 [Nowakowskiella sp. JEL0407]